MSGSPWGGSEELWYRTALQAVKEGWKVGCAVYHWPGKKEKLKQLSDLGARIYYLPNKGRTKKNLAERLQNKISKIKTKKYINALPVQEYDLVIINQGAFEITTSVWKDFHKKLKKYVLLFHNYKEHEVFKPAKALVIQNWINHASLNLFASGQIKEVLENNSGIKISRNGLLTNPITFSPGIAPEPYPSLLNNTFLFVMLAALEVNRKAQDNLIKALSSPKWKARNWTLHLYGEGKDRKVLENLILENTLTGKVFLEGHTNDVKTVLREAHLVLQMTHIDAMPLTVVEAMAVGRPVVVSKIGDMPEWVKEGLNGWISNNASVEQIDLCLEEAWQQKEQWEKMGAYSFEIFTEKFEHTPEKHFLNQLEKLLEKENVN
jgi:glycosyltransferase involved in cell wall biosynthesis